MNRHIIIHITEDSFGQAGTEEDANALATLLAKQGWRVSTLPGINDGQGATEAEWQEAMAAFSAGAEQLGIYEHTSTDFTHWDRTTED